MVAVELHDGSRAHHQHQPPFPLHSIRCDSMMVDMMVDTYLHAVYAAHCWWPIIVTATTTTNLLLPAAKSALHNPPCQLYPSHPPTAFIQMRSRCVIITGAAAAQVIRERGERALLVFITEITDRRNDAPPPPLTHFHHPPLLSPPSLLTDWLMAAHCVIFTGSSDRSAVQCIWCSHAIN